MKKKLLEHLVRNCTKEVLDQIQFLNEEETKGAAAPPADGLGTADQPPIPKESKKSHKASLTYVGKYDPNFDELYENLKKNIKVLVERMLNFK